MTRVFLLRHAESANPYVFHGAESDVTLSPLGHRQAEAVATVLAAHKPHAIISSAMRRARETAEPIARACSLPILLEPDLHERRVGQLSGMPFQSHDNIWPQTVERWIAGDTSFTPPGAESFDDIHARVFPVWRRVTTSLAGHTIVIVAHGIVCKVLLLSILADFSVKDWSRFGPIPNVSVTELLFDNDTWHPVTLNQQPEIVAHLDRT